MLAREKLKFNEKISGVEKTNLKLTGRAGLAAVSDYIRNNSWLMRDLEKMDSIKGCKKGTSVHSMIIQIICYFFDGTSLNLSRFDELKNDPAYPPLIGVKENNLCSTSAVKRLLRKFSFRRDRGFKSSSTSSS